MFKLLIIKCIAWRKIVTFLANLAGLWGNNSAAPMKNIRVRPRVADFEERGSGISKISCTFAPTFTKGCSTCCWAEIIPTYLNRIMPA